MWGATVELSDMPEGDGETFDAVVAMPGFALGLRLGQEALTEIRFLSARPALVAGSDLAAEVVRQLLAYRDDPDFRFHLPLAPKGTPFRHRVWAAIAAIPKGEVRTYGELARALGSSARAVGQACGDNPLPVIVPCHRVVAKAGLGGFAHSREGRLPDIKRWLLRHEGAL